MTVATNLVIIIDSQAGRETGSKIAIAGTDKQEAYVSDQGLGGTVYHTDRMIYEEDI